MSFPQKRESI